MFDSRNITEENVIQQQQRMTGLLYILKVLIPGLRPIITKSTSKASGQSGISKTCRVAQLASSASRNELPCMGCKWSGVYNVADVVRVGRNSSRYAGLRQEAVSKGQPLCLENIIMEFCTYIIFSKSLDRYYAGITSHIDIRLKEHNRRKCHSTATADDWVIVYSQSFNSRIEAYNHEKHIKGIGPKRYFENLQGGAVGQFRFAE
jgi:putative endonuclease